ncbi:MAG: hypothetical protein ACO3VH_07190 [Ilumatobacteraceae bacterium]
MPRKPASTATETTTETAPESAPVDTPNLAIWNSVCETDPRHTKSFSRGGGFSGTAINHTYQTRRATETFGPKGIGWGVEILSEDWRNGAPFLDDKHGVIGHETVHVLRIKLWYKHGDERGEIISYGQTTFVGKNKHGIFTDEEAPKKSLTDAESKALASLGFSADIHLGLYDNNKYVNDLKARIEQAEKPKGPTLAEVKAKVEAAATADALKAIGPDAATLTDAERAELRPIWQAKVAALKDAAQ